MSKLVDKMFQAAPGFDGDGEDTPEVTAFDRGKFDLNDRGNAARLKAVIGGDVIWCPEWGWGVWSGTHYDFDGGEVKAFNLCLRLQDIVEAEAVAQRDAEVTEFEAMQEIGFDVKRTGQKKRGSIDQETAEKAIRAARYARLHNHALKCGDVATVQNAIKALKGRIQVRLADLNCRPSLLTVQNGLVDLDRVIQEPPDAEDADERLARWRGFLVENDRQSRPTRVCATDFDAAANWPKFQAFLDLIMPQAHLQAYLNRVCGQLVGGTNDYQIALLFQGEGANGKSTLMNILSGVLGSYVATCKIEMFLATELRSSSAATPDEADLPGARAYAATEPEPNSALSDAKVKAFTGGDTRKSRANYGSPFEWKPTGVPVLAFNRLPAIKGDSFGTRRRLAFVPFTQNLRDLPADMQRSAAAVEAEMVPEYPGILNWLLHGYAESRHLGGLHPPPEAEALKEALMSASDPVGEFLKSCTIEDDAGRVKTSEFHGAFAAWAEDTGASAWKAKTVRSVLIQKGFKVTRIRGYEHYTGLTWNTEDATVDYLDRAAFRGGRSIA